MSRSLSLLLGSLALGGVLASCAPLFAAEGESFDSLLEPIAPSGFKTPAPAKLGQIVQRLETDSQRHVLNAEALVRELEKELSARFGVNGELKLSLIRPWTTLELPAEDFTVTVSELPADGLGSSFPVKVKVVSAAQTVGEWTVPLRAQLWQEMWAASGRIERGQTLDRALLAVQKVDVLRERTPLLSAETDPSTYETTQSITSPRLLTRRDISERPIVRKGQVVEVVAKHGLLALSMKALALENGGAGALIRLRNLESRKEFSGQITHENQVQVQF